MRRLIQAATIVGAMVPATAFAQSTTAGSTIPSADPSSAGTPPSTSAPVAPTRPTVAGHGDDAPTAGNNSSGSSSDSTAPAAGGSSSAGGTTTLSDRGNQGGSASSTATPPPLPFRNSILIVDHSISAETLFPGTQLTPEPSLQTWISFRPRWYFNNDISLRGRADVTVEWLENANNSDTHIREPELNDFSLDLVYTGLSHFIEASRIIPSLGFGIAFPTSLASQYRGVWAVPGTLRASVGASRKFEHLGPGDLSLGLTFLGSHAFTAATTSTVQGPGFACDTAADLPTVCHAVSGAENNAFTLWSFLTAGYTWRGFGLNLTYVLINNWAYGTPDATLTPTDGMSPTVNVMRAANDQRLRQSGWFFASLDYDIVSWLTASLGYYCFRPILDPSGNYGNPFWAPDGASRIFLTATFNLDSLYDTVYRAATGHQRSSAVAGAQPHNNGQLAHQAMMQQMTGLASF